MREVGVHFYYVAIAVFKRPVEPGYVSASEAVLFAAREQVQAVAEFVLKFFYRFARAVGRVVVHYQYVEVRGGDVHYRTDYVLDILDFVVSRYYYYRFIHISGFSCVLKKTSVSVFHICIGRLPDSVRPGCRY